VSRCPDDPQWRPTPERENPLLCWDLEGRPLGPSPPPLAVAGLAGRKENGPTLPLYDVYKVKPMYPSGDHGRGHRLALQNRAAVDLELKTPVNRCGM